MPRARANGGEADRLIVVSGTVQGVGFRPFVARLARRLGLRGWVRNDADGVTVRVIGPPAGIEAFSRRLRTGAPPAARVVTIRRRAPRRSDGPPPGGSGFVILASEADAEARTAAIVPDLALCDECRCELGTPGNRRHAYPFINCTNCGPRYSIIERPPYDRERTTMAAFRMCPSCEREFRDPEDRRYHAQPNACPECGPHVVLTDGAGRVLAGRAKAITAAAQALQEGKIVAVKGLGGFHLMVDAANEGAVRELRRRKHREEKPLAVMFPSLEALRLAVKAGAEEVRHLLSAAAPIVLLRRRAGAAIAGEVAPGNPWIGALLPYTPLHVLLLEAVGRPVVATSGNLSEEPLCTDDGEARGRLGDIADLFLGHNRPIAQPVDDSVVRIVGNELVVLRRARGFAPAPIRLPRDARGKEALLCVGGHLKNTVAVSVGREVVLSPHVGDLGNPMAVAAFRRATELLGALHGRAFERVACDLHPDYASTRFAESLGLPVVPVQHHLAHILACLLEHGGGPPRGSAWLGMAPVTAATVRYG
ncbi:MAG: carbamoyltransferase HypF, partial [Opitutus sp.]